MKKRGGVSLSEKILNKQNKVGRVNITLSIPQKLLSDVETNIEGDNRSRKIVRCVVEGFRRLTQ